MTSIASLSNELHRLPEARAPNVFDYFADADDENRHSDLLAAFLDYRRSGPCARKFACGLLALCTGGTAQHFAGPYQVFREYQLPPGRDRIDILIHFYQAKVAAFIEVKINAALGNKQIERYCKSIKVLYNRWGLDRVYMILIDRGTLSIDTDSRSGIDIRHLQHADLAPLLSNAYKTASTIEHRLLAKMLRERFMALSLTNDRRKLRDLWVRYPRQILALEVEKPRLADCREKYEASMARALGELKKKGIIKKFQVRTIPENPQRKNAELNEIQHYLYLNTLGGTSVFVVNFAWWVNSPSQSKRGGEPCPFVRLLYPVHGGWYAGGKVPVAEVHRTEDMLEKLHGKLPRYSPPSRTIKNWSMWADVWLEHEAFPARRRVVAKTYSALPLAAAKAAQKQLAILIRDLRKCGFFRSA